MKRGFTLIELLAVTILLGIIMAVSYPALFKIFDDKENEIDSNKKQIIENTAINYAKENINEFENGNNCLFLKQLIDKNKLGDIIDENLNNRIIKININDENYSAQLLDENVTCNANQKTYEVKQCTQNSSTSKYNLIDNKTTYYIDNIVVKQIDVVEGTNINDSNFSNQINSYNNLANTLKNNSNFNISINKNQEYFKMYTEITLPTDIVLTQDEKIALENASIFYNSGVIKTTC